MGSLLGGRAFLLNWGRVGRGSASRVVGSLGRCGLLATPHGGSVLAGLALPVDDVSGRPDDGETDVGEADVRSIGKDRPPVRV